MSVGGDVTLTNSTVSGNSTSGESADGGGIYAIGDVTLIDSTVSGNYTSGLEASGGGIYAKGDVTLTDSTVIGNSTNGDNASGGGIRSRGDVTLLNSTVSGNSADTYEAGGGGISASGAVSLTDSTVSENSVKGQGTDGGGIAALTVTLTNSTVSGNYTSGELSRGGGIWAFGDVTLTNSTVTNNHADYLNSYGGGIWNDNDPIVITSSIVAGNSASGGSPDLRPGTGTLSVNYSLIGDTSGLDPGHLSDIIAGTGNILNVDPLLGPLADNGGPTETQSLLPGSPAIDSGDPSISQSPAEFDQRGSPFGRVVDIAGGGDRIDIGAVELQGAPASLVVDTLTDELDGDFSPGDLSLREAIGWANVFLADDTITFDASLDGGMISLDPLLGELAISDEVTINATNLTGGLTIDAQQNSRIFNITATTGDFTLAGLTLIGGKTTGGNGGPGYSSTYSGGAIRSVTIGNLTIEQSSVSGNSITGEYAYGGGIFAAGNVILADSTVSSNSASGNEAEGGGIWANVDVTLTNSTVSDNSSEANGGGIRANDDVTLANSTVSGNSTSGDGGGVLAFGDVTLTNSAVRENVSTGDSGGGIRAASGSVTLINSTVSENSSGADGGGIVGTLVTLTNSTVSDNSSVEEGGGIAGGTVTLTNSSVSGNSTSGLGGYGGGIAATAVTLTRSTVTDNHANFASATGGGIWIWAFSGAVDITSSILAGNTAGGGNPDLQPGTGTLSVDYSLIGDNLGTVLVEAPVGSPDANGNLIGSSTGGGIINPLLAGLTNNGGPTETHALLPGSPAFNAGDPSVLFEPLEFDQRGPGFPRVEFSRIDIGAVEFPATALPGPTLLVDTLDDELDGNVSPGDLALREALWLANLDPDLQTITFDGSLDGGTILLILGELAITDVVTIDASSLTGGLTIDAGDGTDNVFATGDGSRIFNIDDSNSGNQFDVQISGLTLTGGDVPKGADTYAMFGSGSDGESGGAIRSIENLTITHSSITGNAAGKGGSSFSLIGFPGYGGHGGGIYSTGNLVIANSIISGNITGSGGDSSGYWEPPYGISGGYGGSGGGILSGGNLTITDSTVSGNVSSAGGSNPDYGPNYDGSGGGGGGIFVSGSVTLTDSTVSGNETRGRNAEGGGVFAFGVVSLTRSTVSGNSTLGAGSSDGGGIYAKGAVTISQSTIAENSVLDTSSSGGGIWNNDDAIDIDNSIVADNTAGGSSPDLAPGTGVLTVNYSLIGVADGLTIAGSGNQTGTTATPLAPQLGPLANNGGPTWTHALLPGSPALDAGDPSIAFNPAEFDQRGAPLVRVFDDPVAAGTGIDIGAYERQTLGLVVDTTGDENDGDYSVGNLSLREAILLANANASLTDAITFDASLDGGTILLTLGELGITDSLTMDATSLASGLTIDAQQNSRIFHITATSGDFTFAGLTVTGGRMNIAGTAGRGGAIRSLSTGVLTIDQSTIVANKTDGERADGGGIWAIGDVTLTQSDVRDNSTNLASGEDFGYGGGILSTGDVTLIESTVSGNSTNGPSAGGGGIFASGNVTLVNSTISANSTTASNAEGGGIFASGSVMVTNSTVSGNSTLGAGSADGGGIYAKGAVTISQSTITENSVLDSSSSGGGIWNDNDTINIDNSIVADNTAGGSGPDLAPGTGLLTINYSLIGVADGLTITGSGNQTGTTATPLDPLLGPLANNGGPTETHALVPGSPAIDAGDPGFSPPPDFDQRGAPFVRVFDDTVAAGTGVDIGAYERQDLGVPQSLVVDTLGDESDGDYGAGDLSLREAIGLANGNVGIAESISFYASLDSGTILLALGELGITDSLTIDATSLTGGLTIDAQQNSRIANIIATTGDFTLAGLTLLHGATFGSNSSFSDLTHSGGAISSITSGLLTISQSTVSGNTTIGTFAIGGGVAATGNIHVLDSSIINNSTSGMYGFGGGIIAGGTILLKNSTVSGNSVTGPSSGAGGVGSFSDITLENSTVSGNRTGVSSGSGGGVYANGAITVKNSTVTGNHSYSGTGLGGGILHNSSSALSIRNSIIAGNTAVGGFDDIRPGTGSLVVDYSLIGTNDIGPVELAAINSGAGNLLDVNHLLAPLTDNGGPTETHALLPGSPAIDAGDPGFVGPPNFDQRGTPFVRVVDGDAVSGARIDMGAYEWQSLGLVVDTISDEIDGDYSAGDFSLREAIGLSNANAVIADTITFDISLDAGTILLTLGELAITDSLTIDASSLAGGLTIDASGNDPTPNTDNGDGSRIFNIDNGDALTNIDVDLHSLTLTGGDVTGDGGAILSVENLTLTDMTITGNAATGAGGITLAQFSQGSPLAISALSTGYSAGGGVAMFGGASTISGSTITGNRADYGGGVFSDADLVGASTQIANSTISGNTATVSGGGILNYDGLLVLEDSTVTANYAPNGSGSGVASSGNYDTLTEVRTSVIAGNVNSDVDVTSGGVNSFVSEGNNLIGEGNATAAFDNNDQTNVVPPVLVTGDLVVDITSDESDENYGPGDLSLREAIEWANVSTGADTITFDVSLSGGTILLTLDEMGIAEAVAIDATSLAGGLMVNAQESSRIFNITTTTGDFTFAGLTLTGGKTTASSEDGGAIRSITSGNLMIDQSTVTGNSTEGDGARGGGVFAAGTVTVMNSTISGNNTGGTSADGGAMYAIGAVMLTSSTITDNHALGYSNGGGLFAYPGGGHDVTITNTIIAGNTAGALNPDLEPGTATLTLQYSLIGDNAGTSLAEAQIADLNGNLIGSDAGSGIIDPLLGPLANNGGPIKTHAILAGSPAIDAGDPNAIAGVGNVPLYDQRGMPFDRVTDGSGGGARIDIGAYELQTAPSADFDGDNFITGFDFLLWQRGFGTPTPDAVKANGDADDDLDVDAVDLSIWEDQYGTTVAPLVAMATAVLSTESFSTETITTNPAPQPALANGDLVDVALAVAMAEDANGVVNRRLFVEDAPPQGFFSTEPIGQADLRPSSSVAGKPASSATSAQESESPETPSSWEEAFDEVFASVF